MFTKKTVLGASMVAVGLVALGGNYLQNYINVPLADIWVPALAIVIAGTLPALLIVFGSVIIWGELEEKKVEKSVIKTERKIVSKVLAGRKKFRKK